MKKSVKSSTEVQERAVRVVVEVRGQHDPQWAAIESIAAKIGCTAATLRRWSRARVDAGGADCTGCGADERPHWRRVGRTPGPGDLCSPPAPIAA